MQNSSSKWVHVLSHLATLETDFSYSHAVYLALGVNGIFSLVAIQAPCNPVLLSTLLECVLVLNQRGIAGKF